MDAPEETDWDLWPMWRWCHQSSYPTWSSRTLPCPHHEVKSDSPFPLILHRACDSPGTHRMRRKWCSVTPENSPWEEMQLLPCELEHTFGALHHYVRSLRLRSQEEATVQSQMGSPPTAVPTARHVNEDTSLWFLPLAAGSLQPLCLPVWGRTAWRRDEHSLLCLFWIPDPRNPWVWENGCFKSLSFKLFYRMSKWNLNSICHSLLL